MSYGKEQEISSVTATQLSSLGPFPPQHCDPPSPYCIPLLQPRCLDPPIRTECTDPPSDQGCRWRADGVPRVGSAPAPPSWQVTQSLQHPPPHPPSHLPPTPPASCPLGWGWEKRGEQGRQFRMPSQPTYSSLSGNTDLPPGPPKSLGPYSTRS